MARGFEGQIDTWCNGDYASVFYYYIISGWIPTQNILAMRSGLKRSNKTANFNVALVWRLVEETSEAVDNGDWAATPDENAISTTDAVFKQFYDATTAIGNKRYCQFALKVWNYTGSAFNIGQIEYSVELRGA